MLKTRDTKAVKEVRRVEAQLRGFRDLINVMITKLTPFVVDDTFLEEDASVYHDKFECMLDSFDFMALSSEVPIRVPTSGVLNGELLVDRLLDQLEGYRRGLADEVQDALDREEMESVANSLQQRINGAPAFIIQLPVAVRGRQQHTISWVNDDEGPFGGWWHCGTLGIRGTGVNGLVYAMELDGRNYDYEIIRLMAVHE